MGGDTVQGLNAVLDRLSIGELPNIPVKGAEFFLDLKEPFGIIDCRFDFQTIPDNSGVTEESSRVAGGKPGDFFRIKIRERFFVRRSLV